jgi:lysosomal Pro-X carboxypeptidase
MRSHARLCAAWKHAALVCACIGLAGGGAHAVSLEENPLMRGWLDHVQSFPAHLEHEVPAEKQVPGTAQYEFKEHWFDQNLDHVNKQQIGRWWQRYFVYDKFSRHEQNYPLFVFCGAEQGDIFREWERLGFMVEVARSHGAKVLWLEHRFFGKSMPFQGADAFEKRADRVGLLSLEQSMADYAAIIRTHKGEGPVLTFGGSLSGTIAAMLRVQEPTLVDMAFASSAPILGVDGVADPFAWRARMTATFAELGGKGCPDLVRRGFAAMNAGIADANGPSGQRLRRAFRPCESGIISAGRWQAIYGQAWSFLESLGNFVYPSAHSGIPAACTRMSNASTDEEIFARLLNMGVAVPTGVDGVDNCISFTRMESGASMGKLDTYGWSYMACTEVIHPIGANGKTDMFPPYDWTVTSLSSGCREAWNVVPDAAYMQHKLDVRVSGFGENVTVKPSTALPDKIVFTYGDYDPWGTMVPKQGWAADVESIRIPGGSHCSDLETAREDDTEGMLDARRNVSAVLARWISDVQKRRVMKVNSFGKADRRPLQVKQFGTGVSPPRGGLPSRPSKMLRGHSKAVQLSAHSL